MAAVLGRGMAQPLYLLSDAIAARDAATCLSLLETLLDDGEAPLRILGTLHRSLRQVRAVRSLQQERAPREEMAARSGFLDCLQGHGLLEAARRWTEAELGLALSGLTAPGPSDQDGSGDEGRADRGDRRSVRAARPRGGSATPSPRSAR